jgi:hypothetical protein
MIVGPTLLSVSIGTAHRRIDSSKKMNCSIAERPGRRTPWASRCPPSRRAHLLPDATGRFAHGVRFVQFGHRGRIQQLLVVAPQLLLHRQLLWRVPDLHDDSGRF